MPKDKIAGVCPQTGRFMVQAVVVLATVTLAGLAAWGVTTLVAVPINSASSSSNEKGRAIGAEAVGGCGRIRSQMRMYASQHNGDYPTLSSTAGDELVHSLEMGQNDLDGKYFKATDFVVNSDGKEYTIRVAWGDQTYIVNQDGVESGTFKPGF